ncbi:MAG: hypothetical protein NC314_03455 [Roseburia sp.]|nr:hypothetical protein [Roseburia sp.]MCM1241871.1 hypothetical protein [Roseburia sp.]
MNYCSLTREQFDVEMEKGMADVKAGRVYLAEDKEKAYLPDIPRYMLLYLAGSHYHGSIDDRDRHSLETQGAFLIRHL